MKLIHLNVLILLLSLAGRSQSGPIKGLVKDSLTAAPLPYCNVYVKGSSQGTISNNNGAFRLMAAFNEKDTLIISFIGYKTKKIALGKNAKPLEVILHPEQVHLDEVVVKSHTALEILEMAIAKIPENYFEDPFKSRGFYRVTSQRDSEYVHLSEAIFDLYQSKRKRRADQFKLQKMRATKDEEASKGFYLGLNPRGVFEMDIVNYSRYIQILTKDGLELHDFQFAPSQNIEGRATFKITFNQKQGKFSGYKGYFIIDRETLAFLHLNFGLSPQGLKYHKYGSAELRARLAMEGIELDMSRNDTKVWYKKVGEKYYLSNATNDAEFRIQSKLKQYDFEMVTRVDYLVTSIDTLNVERFKNSETLNLDRLIESQDSNFDESFWDEYTILLPTESFSKIAREIELKNNGTPSPGSPLEGGEGG